MTDPDGSQKSSVDCDDNKKSVEWTDELCIKISRQDTFPAVIKDLKVQKSVISRFLNFYLGGKIEKGLNITDLVFAVIAIMPVSLQSEEFIWDDSEYSEQGTLFYLTPEDKLRFEIKSLAIEKSTDETKNVLNDEKLVGNETQAEPCLDNTEVDKESLVDDSHTSNPEKETIPDVSTDNDEIKPNNEDDDKTNTLNDDDKTSTTNDESPIWQIQWLRKLHSTSKANVTTEKEYGPVENAEFCISCNYLLAQWESSMCARTYLKYFFAMAALVVMRARVKTYQNLTKYFSTKFFDNLYFDEKKPYTIPHRGFIKKCWKVLRQSDHSIAIMFSKLVINSFLGKDRLNNYGKENILRFAILSHTADYGMGIISLLQMVANKTINDKIHRDFKLLFDCLYSEETSISWNRVNDFFKKYMLRESRQYTFHWAYVIINDEFKHLSCPNNYELAVVIAVFIEKLTNDTGVWRSVWVKTGQDLERYKKLGNKLFEDYQDKNKNDFLSLLLQRE